MDRERKKRIQTVKLIITEIIMVITVVIAVIILTFVAMGYNVNKDGDLAQSGLLQVKSIPTGAAVTIDGETMSAKTNMSKMLSGGQHFLVLSKDGYDTWSKTITSEPGWLLKLDYPKLFLKNRTMEKVREYNGNIQIISYSPDASQIIYKVENDEKWTLLNISGDDVNETKLDLSKYIGSNETREINWSKNNDKLLMRTKNNGENEWIVINLRSLENSINITKEFNVKLSKIDFLTGVGDRLIVLENGNLRIISIGERTMSQVLAKNVEDFSHNEDDIVYIGGIVPNKEVIELVNAVKKDEADEESDETVEVKSTDYAEDRLMRAVMFYSDNTDDSFVMNLKPGAAVKLTLFNYLGKDYYAVTENEQLKIFAGSYPRRSIGLSDMEKIVDEKLKIIPNELIVWTEGELMMAKNGNNIAMFDAELTKLSEYELESDNTFFPDEYLLGTVADGELIVRDFDGENRRILAKSEASGGVISKNHKWLYYSLVVDGKTNIFRERIID